MREGEEGGYRDEEGWEGKGMERGGRVKGWGGVGG